jgi:glycosyltransferase involved in cell wall biosynthesis
MKIAVYLGDISSSESGAFTFQDDIFSALLNCEGAKQHTFVIYSNLPKQQTSGRGYPNLEWEARCTEKRERILRFVSTCFEASVFIADSLHFSGWFDRSLRKHAAEMVWFLTPSFHRTELPYIYTVWDLQHRMQPWFPEVASYGRGYFRDKSFSRAIARATTVVVPNEAGREQLTHLYSILPDRVLMLPEPTPSFALEASAERGTGVLRKYGLTDNYLFYPAQLWPHKNHVNLLAATKLLKERSGIVLSLVFVGGDQGNEAHIRAMADDWKLSEQLYLLGHVSREDLIGLYRNALALTYMSFIGPSNLPPLEAFALGCPVIASRIPGAQEQMGDAALLVDPTDIEGLAAAIESVYSDESFRQELICRGRDRASRWTAKEYVAKLLAHVDDFTRVRRCWRSGDWSK